MSTDMKEYVCGCGNHGIPEVLEHGLKRFVCQFCGSVITSRKDRIKARKLDFDLRHGVSVD